MFNVIYFICSYLNFTRINSCPFKYFVLNIVLINCHIVYFYPCFLILVFILSLCFMVLFHFSFYWAQGPLKSKFRPFGALFSIFWGPIYRDPTTEEVKAQLHSLQPRKLTLHRPNPRGPIGCSPADVTVPMYSTSSLPGAPCHCPPVFSIRLAPAAAWPRPLAIFLPSETCDPPTSLALAS